MISRSQIYNLRSRKQPSKRIQLHVTRVFFLSLLSRKFDDRLSSNFHRFIILCICWDTPTVKASLWQLPKVSTAFNLLYFCRFLLKYIFNKINYLFFILIHILSLVFINILLKNKPSDSKPSTTALCTIKPFATVPRNARDSMRTVSALKGRFEV